jgi:predicted glycosyltransferase
MRSRKIDIVLYAHDGRGHGHISRTVAIALALRRIEPKLTLLIITGSSKLSELILPDQNIDWIKLPSYRSLVHTGTSVRMPGPSGLDHLDIASFRQKLLKDIISNASPRCIIADHLPLGKDGELASALAFSSKRGTKWFLGLRAIIGRVPEIWSDPTTQSLTKSHYTAILWYGCTAIHGNRAGQRLRRRYCLPVIETSLVSRARELNIPRGNDSTQSIGGTIGIPWTDLQSEHTLRTIINAEPWHLTPTKRWRLFLGPSRAITGHQESIILPQTPQLLTSPFTYQYLPSLSNSAIGISYAGYNTITDLLWTEKPAILITRNTEDGEQVINARRVAQYFPSMFHIFSDSSVKPATLIKASSKLMGITPPQIASELLSGADIAARYLLNEL